LIVPVERVVLLSCNSMSLEDVDIPVDPMTGKKPELITSRVKPSGTHELEFSQGTKVQVDTEGVIVIQHAAPDVKKETRYPRNGSYIVIRSAMDGSKVQTNPDGSSIVSYPNGNKVQRMANGIVITEFKDRSTLQVDPDGRQIRKWPDGRLQITQSDGTLITMGADGVKHTQHPNGVSIESRPDGTKVQSNVDGSRIELQPDRTKFIYKTDGSMLISYPNGDKVLQSAEGIRGAVFPSKRADQAGVDKEQGLGPGNDNLAIKRYIELGEEGDRDFGPLNAKEKEAAEELIAELIHVKRKLMNEPAQGLKPLAWNPQ